MTPEAAYEYVRSIRPRVLLASLQRQAVQDYYHGLKEREAETSLVNYPRILSLPVKTDMEEFDDNSLVLLTESDLDGYEENPELGVAGQNMLAEVNLACKVQFASQAAISRLSLQDKVQNHINTMIRANGGSLEGIDMLKAYMETVGTIKGNVYGLGSWGKTLINNGVNASTTSSTNQDEFFKNLKEELEQQFRIEMETLKAQMEAQVQSQVQPQVQEVMLALFRFGSYPPAANGRPSL